jgi:ATP-dependent RNA helicase DDX35
LLQKQRNLKLIVASATVDAEQLYNFFNHNSSQDMSKDTSVIMSVEGRLYPVDVHYVKGNIVCRCAEIIIFVSAN